MHKHFFHKIHLLDIPTLGGTVFFITAVEVLEKTLNIVVLVLTISYMLWRWNNEFKQKNTKPQG